MTLASFSLQDAVVNAECVAMPEGPGSQKLCSCQKKRALQAQAEQLSPHTCEVSSCAQPG